MPNANDQPMNPGDQAPPGTPGTGEVPCPDCGGSGSKDGGTCTLCAGTGKIVKAVGGA
jgi:DnaJ-class molecular chaperone